MSTNPVATAKFRVGHIICTPHALTRLSREEISIAIQRHQAGDWGDVNKGDHRANDEALVQGTRLWSIYKSAKGTKFWLITEADRSYTTILLPEDY